MPPQPLMDVARLDLTQVVADQAAIRKHNPQRFEMEHLNGIHFVDPSQHLVVGFKDVRDDEFWVRGHMPRYPLLPGALMCEAAAQLCCYYTHTQGISPGDFAGFGGMENVRFRSPVRPGAHIVLVAKVTRLDRRKTLFTVQGFVSTTMVFHADIIGVPLRPRVEGQP